MKSKILSCVALAALFISLSAAEPSANVSGVQSSLRGCFTKASALFHELSKDVAPKYAEETGANSENEIKSEFLNAYRSILSLEGTIRVIPSQQGRSQIWVDRKRYDSYEPRLAIDNYLSGPEKDLILFNQEHIENVTDFSLPSRGGVGFSFRRTYFSNLMYAGPMGNGWDFTYNSRILVDANSSQATLYVNGIAYQFEKISGTWRSLPGNFYLLEEENNRLYVYDSQLSRMEFEKSNEKENAYRLSALSSRHEQYSVNRLTINYQEKTDRISCILDPYGNKIIFSYDNRGRIVQISTPSVSIEYLYDPNGNLSEVRSALIANSFSSTTQFCMKYGYQKIANRFLLTSKITNNSSAWYSIEYDTNGKVLRIGEKSPDSDAMWTVSSIGKQVKVQPAHPAPAIEYTFNSNICRDLPVEISVLALKAKTTLKYNSDGLLESSIDPIGIKKEYLYDSKNDVPYLRMNLLAATTWPIADRQEKSSAHLVDLFEYEKGTAFISKKQFFEFDDSGSKKQLSTQCFTYTKDWNVASENLNGIITRYFYNKYGNRVIVLDANNRATLYFYGDKWPTAENIYTFTEGTVHGAGLCVRTISDASKTELDNACTSLKIQPFIFNDLLRIQPVSRKTLFCYDLAGTPSCIKDGIKITYTIKNRFGNVLASYTTGKGKIITAYDKKLLCTSVLHQFVPEKGHVFQGNKNSFFTGCFFTELFHYDSADRLCAHTTTDELFDGKKVEFAYKRYANGMVQQITDPMGLCRYDEYTEAGLLSKQTLYGNKSSVTLSSNYEYFPDGTIKKYCDALGDTTQNQYDRYGRIAVVTLANGMQKHSQFDGLARIQVESLRENGKEIGRKEWIYGPNGKIEQIFEYQISASMRKKLLKKQYVYDGAGNLVAQRDVQNNSWTYFLLDGLNRTVAAKKATGDISVSIYDADSLVFSYELNPVSKTNYRCTGTLYLRDQLGFPAVVLPVGANQHVIDARRIVNQYNFIGQVCSIKQFSQNEIKKTYNSLGLITHESTLPQTTTFGELPLETSYNYNAGGQIIKKTVNNNALAIFAPQDNASATLVSAPQITTYLYDALSRQSTIQQPDGLIIKKIYDEHSLPIEMIWTHASQPHKKLRHLNLKYGVFAQLMSISDGISKKILREYKYDSLGNCTFSKDYSTNEPVESYRSYDSLGNLLSENQTVGQLRLPGLQIDYELPLGEERVSFNYLPSKSKANWSSQTIRRDCLGRTNSIVLDDSKSTFASWDYCGALPSCRKVPESLITVRHTYSPQNDLIQTDFFEKSSKFGVLRYQYDSEGNNIYSSTSLAENTLDKYTFAQYMGYNSFRQLVEENGENSIPEDDTILIRRDQLFSEGKSIQATKTTRRAYDQADNMWALYYGKKVPALLPTSFTKENLSHFLSPASFLADKSSITQKELWELASNRDTTQAHFSTDGKLTAEVNQYDDLGNLKEFAGEFWNGERSIPVLWKLEFDTMGRLSKMRGYAENDSSFYTKGASVAELTFLYDANNRRIKKAVKDFSRYKTVLERHEFTTYIGNNQALVLKDDFGKISLREQYLWNTDTRELLMAALPEATAENTSSVVFHRYFFQQDRGLNTICVTKNINGKAVLVSGASYLGFGKNATSAKIISIGSSMIENRNNRFAAYNGKLDDNLFSRWENESGKPQYLEMKLARAGDLSSLKIWTNENFPTNFRVFVLPVGAESPSVAQNLLAWSNEAANKGYYIYQQKDASEVTADKPISIPLYNLAGDRVVLLWDSHKESEIAIREIEVTQMPNNPGAFAYAGQWLDCETNMYYQINRYKLAGSNKFISPDPIGFMDGNNLYAYAKNNPLEWHDPNGEWAHIVLGAIASAVIKSGVYAVQCWLTGAEFSWKELSIKAGTGALAGGIAAATFGVVNPFLAGIGMNATANIVISSATAGFTSGFASGSTDTLLHGGEMADALMNGLLSGGWGAAGGAISGGVLSYTGASFGGTVLSGVVGGGTVGGVKAAWDAYEQTGDWTEAAWAALEGAGKGGILGGVVAGSAWGIGRVTEKIVPLEGYPKHMTDPRSKGLLIRTKSGERTYGDMPAKPGYQRQHIKPLSLGGRDVPSNIEYMRNELHSIDTALGGGPQNAHPGAYVNSKPMGTIFF